MLDRALNFGPVQQDLCYFQLIPINLSIVGKDSELPAQGTTYRFSITKGTQKIDQNKFPIQADFQDNDGVPTMGVATCKLNFTTPNLLRARKQQFVLKLVQNQRNQDYTIGQYLIDATALAGQFREKGTLKHELKTFFSEDYELDFQIHVEKNRVALEKNVKEARTEKTNKSAKNATTTLIPKEEQINKNQKQTPLPKKQKQISKGNDVKEIQKIGFQETKQPVADEGEGKTSPVTSEKQGPIRKRSEKAVSQKNQAISQRSTDKVPIIQTKFKQLAKAETPSQIRMTESQRLGKQSTESKSQGLQASENKQKLIMWLFLVFGAVFMYFSMHPNRRV